MSSTPMETDSPTADARDPETAEQSGGETAEQSAGIAAESTDDVVQPEAAADAGAEEAPAPPPPPPVIGLDVGAWECCVAMFVPGQVMPAIVSNNLSLQETRNMVAFVDDDRFIGEEAVSQFTSRPKNTVPGVCAVLGRTPAEIAASAAFTPYDVVALPDGSAAVKVSFRGGERTFSLVHVYAMMLRKLVSFAFPQGAAAAEGGDAGKVCAVLTVPVTVAKEGRLLRAVLDAARVAGLDVKRVVSTSTAAAAQYGFTKMKATEEAATYLFLDAGHDTVSVQVVTYTAGACKVLASVGSAACGGQSFDAALMRLALDAIRAKYKLDPASNVKAMSRLWKAVEQAKRKLSTTPQVDIEVPCLLDDKDVSVRVTRDAFEEAARPLAKEVEGLIASALKEAGGRDGRGVRCRVRGGRQRGDRGPAPGPLRRGHRGAGGGGGSHRPRGRAAGGRDGRAQRLGDLHP